MYSQAVAIAVCEGRLGKLHHSSPAFSNDFGSPTQQFLGFCERFVQLFLPLHKLWIALRIQQGMNQLFVLLSSTRAKEEGTYLTLHHKLLPSFDAQQDTLLVFHVCFFHGHNLLHRQQVLL